MKADKGTKKTASKKEVTAIKDSVEPKKSFMDLFDQVMVNEEGEDIESPAYDDESGDFPETEGEVPVEGEEMGEGEIYSQLSDLFGQLAGLKGAELGAGEEEAGMEGEMEGEMPPAKVLFLAVRREYCERRIIKLKGKEFLFIK